MHVHSHLGKRRADIVLGGKGIAAGDGYLRAAVAQNEAEIRCFGLKMNANRYAKPLEGLLFDEALTKLA